MSEKSKGFFDLLDEEEREENTGVGTFGKIKIETGYVLFPSSNADIPSSEREKMRFSFDLYRPETKKKAKADALAYKAKSPFFTEEERESKRKRGPYAATFFTIFADEVIGRDWDFDLVKVFVWFGDAWKQVVKSQLAQLNAEPGEYWARVQWIADPSGRTHEDDKGEEVPDVIPVPTEIFKSREEMIARKNELDDEFDSNDDKESNSPASSESSSSKYVGVPDGWPKEGWEKMSPTITSMLKDGKSPLEVANNLKVDIKYITPFME